MPSLPFVVFLVVTSGLALKGVISNSFIIAVITTAWAKCGSLNTSEQLLLTLAVCNFCFTTSHMTFAFCYYWVPGFCSSFTTRSIDVFCVFVTLSRYWFTAWLCVFYCVRIVNSTHFIFLWCKLRISQLIPWLLGGFAVISFFTSFVINSFTLQPQSNKTANIRNVAQEKSTDTRAASLATGCGFPFLIVLLCCVLIVVSLWRHVSQMTGEGPSSSSPQMEAHRKAAGTVLSLLFLYISFYVAHIMIMNEHLISHTLFQFVCFDVVMLDSPAQAAILILVNPKLKQAAAQRLARIKSSCCIST